MDRYYHRSSQVGSRVVEGEAVLVKMPESRLWPPGSGLRPTEPVQGRGEAREPDAVDARRFLDDIVEMGPLGRANPPAETAEAFAQECYPGPVERASATIFS